MLPAPLNKARGFLGARARVAAGLCFLLLPAFFTVRSLADRAALNAALDDVFTPKIPAGYIRYPASRINLRRALDSHRSYKEGIYYPLLSDYYAWLVFDNLILPDAKLNQLEELFFGPAESGTSLDPFRRTRGGRWRGSSVRDRSRMPSARRVSRDVVLQRTEVRTQPAGERQTKVTCVLTLENPGAAAAEYVATLPLPPGVYVNGSACRASRAFRCRDASWRRRRRSGSIR